MIKIKEIEDRLENLKGCEYTVSYMPEYSLICVSITLLFYDKQIRDYLMSNDHLILEADSKDEIDVAYEFQYGLADSFIKFLDELNIKIILKDFVEKNGIFVNRIKNK